MRGIRAFFSEEILKIFRDKTPAPVSLSNTARFIYFVLWIVSVLLAGFFSNGTFLNPGGSGSTGVVHYADCKSTLEEIETAACGDEDGCIGNLVVRCPAYCLNTIRTTPDTVYGQSISLLRPFISGSPSGGYYVGSQTCPAAIHAGVSYQYSGGCFKYRREAKPLAELWGSTRNGAMSVPLDGNGEEIPVFKFDTGDIAYSCVDLSIFGSLVNGMFTIGLISMELPPFFTYMATSFSSFWTVVLFLGLHQGLWIVSSYTRSMTCMAYLYTVCKLFFREHFKTHKKRPICAFIFTVVINIIIHIDIIGYKLKFFKIQQGRMLVPGAENASIALIVGVILGLLILITKESLSLYRRGALIKYLSCYAIVTLSAIFLPGLFGLKFRIHHWMLGLYILPLIQSGDPLSSAVMGIATGLFVQGIARYDLRPPVVK